jgi:hypothetical protein
MAHKVGSFTCTRCGAVHVDLMFVPLHNPLDDFSHWALCPLLGEPILFFYMPGGLSQVK